MFSSGNFNSEFDTYLLTSVKYGVQRQMLWKEFSTPRSSLWTCLHQKGEAPGRACSQPGLPREAGALSIWTKQGLGVDRRGCFLIMLLPFHSPCLLQLLLPNNTPSSVTAAVLPFLSDHCPAYTPTPTPSLLFHIAASWAICLPACVFSQLLSGLMWFCVGFFSYGGLHPLKLSRSPVYMMRSTGILPVAQPWKPAYAAGAAATGPYGLLSSLIPTRHFPGPASFAHDSSQRFL